MKIETIKVGQLETNCYLIIKGNLCLIVDPGDEFEKIKFKIRKLNLSPLKVLITHNHFDHIGALNSILKNYNIGSSDFNDYKNDDIVNSIEKFKFKMITTPGHKPDSITYYFFEDNVMFTGDFLFNGTVGRWDLAGGNKNNMYESIEKIKNYDGKTIIYPGHGDSTILKNEINNNEHFRM